jgi:hypothetical protein
MTDRQLFRGLVIDFVGGVALGCVFAGLLLFLNVQHLLDAVQSSGSPIMVGAILVGGCSVYFGLGASITGFHFTLFRGETEQP